jgi:hypothetical protein
MSVAECEDGVAVTLLPDALPMYSDASMMVLTRLPSTACGGHFAPSLLQSLLLDVDLEL